MAKLTGAHLFIRCLKLEGIEKVFTIVGDTILPLVDAAEDEGIQFIDARHEGALGDPAAADDGVADLSVGIRHA